MSDVTQDAWFYTRNGEQIGPVTMADMRIKASTRELDPRHDMVWRTGMDEWKPAGEIDGLFERRIETPSLPDSTMAPAPNPYESGIDETHDQLMAHQSEWPGVRRFGYIVGSILLGVLMQTAPLLLPPLIQPTLGENTPFVLMTVVGITALLSVALGAKRFLNLGMTGWWMLGLLVPFLNWWLGYRLFACPPGYAMHRKMDGVGIFLAIVYWLFIALGIVVVTLVILALLGVLSSPEYREKIQEILQQAKAQYPAR